MKTIRIGTRGSPLALRQVEMVRAALSKAWPQIQTEQVVIKTSGDWDVKDGEKRLETKGDFAKEIEQALMEGRIDIAVHSMKDMESVLPDGLIIEHMLEREDVRDCLLFNNDLADNTQKISDLPKGSIVGTASVRRQAYVLSVRSDLKVVPLRGNVQTRIEKVRSGQVDMTMLALAGLKRLGLEDEVDGYLDPEEMLPAAGQGAIGIEMRQGEDDIAEILDAITHRKTVLCVSAERAALRVLDGSCHTPIGAYAVLNGDKMRLRLSVLRLDGSEIFEEEAVEAVKTLEQARVFGEDLGHRLKRQIPLDVLQQRVVQ